MGARTQVKLTGYEKSVYLYAHWGAGGATLTDVQTALKRKERWGDSEYLARIIFCQMVGDNIDGVTGYGISASEHGDNEELIIVDTDEQKVRYIRNTSPGLQKLEKHTEGGHSWTFKEFLKVDLDKFFSNLNNH